MPSLPSDMTTDDRAIHAWFELSYAQFLAIPRIFMQGMPGEWQAKMVALLNELDDTFDWRPEGGCYHVTLKDDAGKFVSLDPNVCDYRHGKVDHLRKTCKPGEHKWVGKQQGGNPADVESCEWVCYCDVCGVENHEDD